MPFAYRSWSGFAAPLLIITILFGTVYACGQQILRQGADDPQVAMSEDAAHALEISPATAQPLAAGMVDIAASQSSYLILYAANGQPLGGNGYLESALPVLPNGVLAAAAAKGQNRLTWQPRPGLRQAIVVTPAGSKGFAVAGRSLRETERRIGQLGRLVFFGWLVSLLALAASAWLMRPAERR